MTTPPSVPMPPQPAVPMMTGLEELDDMPDELDSNFAPDVEDGSGNAGWADPSQAAVADPEYLAQLDPQDEKPDTDVNEIEPGVPAQPEAEKKKRKTGPHAPSTLVAIDWSKATPRKADEFAATPGGAPLVSLAVSKVRDFLNAARQDELYGLYYPVLEYGNRNSAQATVTRINTWRKGPTNKYGVRDGEEINAKCERQEKDKYVVWVALLIAPEAKGEVNPKEKTISMTPDPKPEASGPWPVGQDGKDLPPAASGQTNG